jgi:hypothetical protein
VAPYLEQDVQRVIELRHELAGRLWQIVSVHDRAVHVLYT